ncbi:sulfotransferase [Aestuariispira ectoiniformans]|uniref:sulfotransferase n=1 Tax=Aestuariispira ectoiniformans TaxID=2775080 RepID=UPI00223C3236|nr:sulfotransferase [Aestuariispira ectoiniformans]
MTAKCDSKKLPKMEKLLFETFLPSSCGDTSTAPVVFILASPRTGSTFLYQSLVAALGLPYFDNNTNEHFAETPMIGLTIRAAIGDVPISFESSFGKTGGAWQPSEASAIMTNWFGGGHPSETVSARIQEGKLSHIVKTFQSAYALFSKPFLIKNAWNCFRVQQIREIFPNAAFIWLKRDIADAASSDLAARYVTKGDPLAWNSATPRNYDDLLKRPYYEQVVENQYEFGRALSESLNDLPSQRFVEVWYEDLKQDFEGEIRRIASSIDCLTGVSVTPPSGRGVLNSGASGRKTWAMPTSDVDLIKRYVETNGDRLASLRFL